MNKSNFNLKFFKNINQSINKLLEKNLNKLNRDNLINIAKSNKIFVTFVMLSIFFLTYLSIPNIFNQSDVIKEFKKQLSTKYNIDFKFTNNLDYKLFPRPHYVTNQAIIIYKQEQISIIKDLKIFISLKNLFNLNSIKINRLIIDSANFDLNIKNQNFFTKLLNNNFLNSSLSIIKSKIFFRNNINEILFINKISEMKYFYDTNEFKNILFSENELFNIPYSVELINNLKEKKLKVKININTFRLQIENQHVYDKEIKSGFVDLNFNNLKSKINYKKSKNYFKFSFFEKKESKKFFYDGELYFKPFYSTLNGFTEELNLFYLFNSNGVIFQILKTELLNKKNLNLKLNINAKKILNYNSIKNIFLNSNIQEGLIDIDDTVFSWKNNADFKLFNSLIYVKDGELLLDANTQIKINDYNNIYKFLLTPKNFRNKINKVDFNFIYNFDQKILTISDIRIDDKTNEKVSKLLKDISIKNNRLKNKILFKKLLNKALKVYAG